MIAPFRHLELPRAAVDAGLVACAHERLVGALAIALGHARVERPVGRLFHPEVDDGESQHDEDGADGRNGSAYCRLGKDLLERQDLNQPRARARATAVAAPGGGNERAAAGRFSHRRRRRELGFRALYRGKGARGCCCRTHKRCPLPLGGVIQPGP